MRSALLCALLLAGCGDDTECVIDSDCADIFQVCMDQRCVDPGAVRDAGRMDGGARDAGEGGVADADVDGGPGVLRSGHVTVTQTPTGDPTTTPHVATATFTETTDGAASPCTTSTMDPCTISDCLIPTPPADAGAPMDAGMPTFPSAGMITIDGDPTDLILNPSADGTYPPASGMGQIWTTDGTVTVTAAGADVPTFTSSIVGPSQSAIGSPSFMTPPVTVSRASDFTFTWTGGSGTLRARLSNSETTTEGTHSVSAVCSYAAADATGTIPAAVLALIPAGDSASFSAVDVAEDSPDVTDWSVTVELTTPATLDTGATSAVLTLTD